ncbi:MAG: NERD domain-containing protein [Bacilli bacterium]|nr:NERD domain-containing protein [Bacilli bacterium]
MPYIVELTLFIVVGVLLVLFFLFLFLRTPIKRFLYEHHTVRMYYKTVNRVALDEDFYLINEWSRVIYDAEGQSIHVDHLLFGNKFIYVIKDRYYQGAISGKADDPNWENFLTSKRKRTPQNPLLLNKIRADHIATLSGLSRAYFISIVLVNDDCLVVPFENESKDNFLVSLSKLEKLIEAIEARKDVAPLKEEQLAIAVRDFAELNQSEKKNGRKKN